MSVHQVDSGSGLSILVPQVDTDSELLTALAFGGAARDDTAACMCPLELLY